MKDAVLALIATVLVAMSAAAAPAFAAAPPKLQVTGASLIVAGTKQRLWSERGNTERAIASTTKLMTVLIVLQHVKNLNQVFTQGPWEDQPGDSQIGLVPGEQMTVKNLLTAALVPSADDAAWDLAYNVGDGSITRFVGMMNAEARKLGLKHTHYSTPTGLDTPGNYSTPDDLVRLADYDMHYSAFFRRTVRRTSAQITVGDEPETVVNTDTLLGTVPWIDGIKTGHTDDAGYVLISEGKQHGLTLIASVLGTSSEYERNANALALLEYGFAEFHRINPLNRSQVLGHIPVAYEKPAPVVASHGFTRVVPRHARVQIKTTMRHRLAGPMKQGAVVGQARVLVGGKVEDRVPLVLKRALPAVSEIKKAGHILGRPFTLVLLALVVGAAVVVGSRRRHPRTLAAGHMEER